MLKIDTTKKKIKKIMLFFMASILFLMQPALITVNNKATEDYYNKHVRVEAGAGVGALSWATIKAMAIAGGSAVAPVAVGLVGAVALGWVVDETIGWDVIADYGQGIIDKVTDSGGKVEDIYDEKTETVKITPEFVEGASTAIDDVSGRRIVDYNGWEVLGGLGHSGNYNISVQVPKDHYIHFSFDVLAKGGNNFFRPKLITQSKDFTGSLGSTYLFNYSIMIDEVRTVSIDKRYLSDDGVREYYNILSNSDTSNANDYVDYSNIRYQVYHRSEPIPEDVIYSDDLAIKETLPDSIDARKTIINNTVNNINSIPLTDGQAVTGVTFPDLVNGTKPEEVDEELPTNDLGIFGILMIIYNYLKQLPMRLVSTFTFLFSSIVNAINDLPSKFINLFATVTDMLQGLWDDLGIVWDGFTENLVNIKGVLDDMLARMMENVSSGIDSLIINTNDILTNIKFGIDNLLINMGDWAANLVNAVGSIPKAISNAWGNLLDGISSAIASGVQDLIDFWQGLKALIGSLFGTLIDLLEKIWSWITDLAEWVIALIIPSSLDVFQPTITELIDTIKQKFAFIIDPIKSFSNAYAGSKSLYDVTFRIKYRDISKDVHVLPIAYKPAVNAFRHVANGLVVVLTYISMYNRFRKEVVK